MSSSMSLWIQKIVLVIIPIEILVQGNWFKKVIRESPSDNNIFGAPRLEVFSLYCSQNVLLFMTSLFLFSHFSHFVSIIKIAIL